MPWAASLQELSVSWRRENRRILTIRDHGSLGYEILGLGLAQLLVLAGLLVVVMVLGGEVLVSLLDRFLVALLGGGGRDVAGIWGDFGHGGRKEIELNCLA